MRIQVFLVQPHPFLHWVLEVSYDRDFQHVVIIQERIIEGSLKDMIYKKVWSEDISKLWQLCILGNYRLMLMQIGQRNIVDEVRDCKTRQLCCMEDKSSR